tara:strand:+ start:3551 stop:4231 length:681 start_codon:yes stop_codon:yes gene_type:complete
MIGNKKVLAITLARGGSTRVPKKNIADVNGKPLLCYTAEQVLASKYIDNYIVSTDDNDIAKIAEDSGATVHHRDPRFAENTTSSAASLLNVLDSVEGEFDYLVEIMATNPLKDSGDIDGVLEKLHETKADSVVSVVRIWDHHPSRVKYILNDKLCDFYPEVPESRRQDLTPAAYVRNGSIYATTMFSFLKNKVRLGPDTRPYIMEESKTINIDEPIDLELARLLLK